MDPNVIRRSQAGDVNAFAALFHQYKNMVYKTAYLMLDSSQEAEDALQEIFVQVHRNLSTYQSGKGAFTTWLHRITVNHCLNRRRRLRWTRFWGDVNLLNLTGTTPSPEEQLGNEVVRQGLSQLSDKLRSIIVLRYYHDLTYADIAHILNIPIGTVKSRLNQAIARLRITLAPDFAESSFSAPTEVTS